MSGSLRGVLVTITVTSVNGRTVDSGGGMGGGQTRSALSVTTRAVRSMSRAGPRRFRRSSRSLPPRADGAGRRERVGEVHRGGATCRSVRAQPTWRVRGGAAVRDPRQRAGPGRAADRRARSQPAPPVVFPTRRPRHEHAGTGRLGVRPARWEDLRLVGAWRRLRAEPASYFRHQFADDPSLLTRRSPRGHRYPFRSVRDQRVGRPGPLAEEGRIGRRWSRGLTSSVHAAASIFPGPPDPPIVPSPNSEVANTPVA
jgi:hypothetical protein